jgi:anti-anti-sigma regulatory factor
MMATSGVRGEVQPGDHVCGLYREDADHWRVVGGQVGLGLARGHRVLYFAEGDPVAAVAQLERSGLSAHTAVAERRLEVTPAVRVYLPDGAFVASRMLNALTDTVQATRAAGWPGLSIVADMAWALGPGADDAALTWYEAQANRVFADGFATAACLYDHRRFPVGSLNGVVSAHQGTIAADDVDGRRTRLRSRRRADPPSLWLSGEVDLSNRGALAAMLAGLLEDLGHPVAPVVIDVSELTFIDAAGAHMLLAATAGVGDRVRLRGCSAMLARMLDLLGQPFSAPSAAPRTK